MSIPEHFSSRTLPNKESLATTRGWSVGVSGPRGRVARGAPSRAAAATSAGRRRVREPHPAGRRAGRLAGAARAAGSGSGREGDEAVPVVCVGTLGAGAWSGVARFTSTARAEFGANTRETPWTASGGESVPHEGPLGFGLTWGQPNPLRPGFF